ncbi:Helix-turn-helix domain-containing protein [Ruminococcaceae bacterium YRB3002]|nr:Helix-turn-helix domain-containing protein [Ruminococcaceae bacterium YRB3002]
MDNSDNEKTTDLMTKLVECEDDDSLASYVGEIDGKYPLEFTSYVKAILEERGMTIADLQRKCGIDRNYIYQIFDGRKKPGRDKIIAIALGTHMTLEECQRALEIAQEGILYPKGRRDSVIIFAVSNGLSVMELNGLLEEYNVPILQ